MTPSRVSAAAVVCLALSASAALRAAQHEVKTPYYRVDLTADGANLQSLSVDSLGHGQFRPSALFPPRTPAAEIHPHSGWSFKFSPKSFAIRSEYRKGMPPTAMTLRFDPQQTHATLLGLVDGGQTSLPAVLHLPDQGSLRIEASSRTGWRLDAHRNAREYVEVVFPAATQANPAIVYSLTVVAIYPQLLGIDTDPRYDGFRRSYLNIFQVQAEDGVLANHSASDPCALTMHMYSQVARFAPPLANGLSAMDLIRMSLDRYLAGFVSYAMPGYKMFDGDPNYVTGYETASLDTYPSLLTAAIDYVTTTHDMQWLKQNYKGLRGWTEKMLSTDTTGDGLLKYAASGNSGSWSLTPVGTVKVRPANWWDAAGFGYEDAYSNALAYHALEGMTELARQAGEDGDAERYRQRARKLHDAFLPAFLDPATGVLAGWRSQDGKLHDYYFPWVTGAAVVYGLIPPETGNAMYDRLLKKMKEVGFTNFELGLPGNLIPIRREDYADSNPLWGGSSKEDGSEGFQSYENGGATASFAFYTVAALYKLGRVADGDRILFPILKSVNAGAFEGKGNNGMTYDWKAWDGTPHGYEGFLSDNFMVLAAAMYRPKAANGTQ